MMGKNATGAIFIVGSMLGFAGEDLFIKGATETLAVGQILTGLGLIAAVLFLVTALVQRAPLFAPQNWSRTIWLRSLLEGVAALFFCTGLATVDIAVVSAVFMITPLATTMLAALAFGEKVGWRRWAAIVVGFIGVIVIIRPGLNDFEPQALYVLGAVLSIAIRDTITSRMPANVSTPVISFHAMLGIAVTAIIFQLVTTDGFVPMIPREMGMITLSAICGTIGYFLLVFALRSADTSAIMPFRYARLIFASLGGMIFFSESPDALTYVGGALVIAAGVYSFARERHLERVALDQS